MCSYFTESVNTSPTPVKRSQKYYTYVMCILLVLVAIREFERSALGVTPRKVLLAWSRPRSCVVRCARHYVTVLLYKRWNIRILISNTQNYIILSLANRFVALSTVKKLPCQAPNANALRQYFELQNKLSEAQR